MEHKKCMEQSNMEDAEKPIVLSEVNTLNAQVPERVMTSSLEKEGYSRGFFNYLVTLLKTIQEEL